MGHPTPLNGKSIVRSQILRYGAAKVDSMNWCGSEINGN